MHERQLAVALLPEAPAIFRVRLLPYTLGHELHLWRRANPYVTMDFDEFDKLECGVRLAATMQAVNVCHQGFEANHKDLKRWRLWLFIASFYNLDKAIEKLRRHILAGHDQMEATLPTDEGHRPIIMGSPKLLRLYQFVCDTIPRSELVLYSRGKRPTYWDFPMAMALFHEQARLEKDGCLNVHSQKDDLTEKYIAEYESEQKAKELE